MKNYAENTKKSEGNMSKYEKICREYEEERARKFGKVFVSTSYPTHRFVINLCKCKACIKANKMRGNSEIKVLVQGAVAKK